MNNVSLVMVSIFYAVMALVAWLLADVWLDLDMWRWSAERPDRHPLLGLGLGASTGLVCVVISQLLDRHVSWARRLGEAFKTMLGPLTTWQIFVIAVTSSVAEEVLFRGFLQQAIALRLLDGFDLALPISILGSSLLFGAMHIGPERRTFMPWTIMAIVMGVVFALMYWWSGNLVAPIVAHFTINFLNLTLMQDRD